MPKAPVIRVSRSENEEAKLRLARLIEQKFDLSVAKQLMRIEYKTDTFKFYHKCNVKCTSALHWCSFSVGGDHECSHGTRQPSNLATHEITKHTDVKYPCDVCSWEFVWTDPRKLHDHKRDVHGLVSAPRKARDPATYHRGCKLGSGKAANRRVRHKTRENSAVSESGSSSSFGHSMGQSSAAYPLSASRLSSPAASDVSDASFVSNLSSSSSSSAYCMVPSEVASGYVFSSQSLDLRSACHEDWNENLPSVRPYDDLCGPPVAHLPQMDDLCDWRADDSTSISVVSNDGLPKWYDCGGPSTRAVCAARYCGADLSGASSLASRSPCLDLSTAFLGGRPLYDHSSKDYSRDGLFADAEKFDLDTTPLTLDDATSTPVWELFISSPSDIVKSLAELSAYAQGGLATGLADDVIRWAILQYCDLLNLA